MDFRLKARMDVMIKELAREHAAELAAAGTLVDLEELTSQIGAEVTRMLTQQEVVRRAEQQREQAAACPDCGRLCRCEAEPEPVVLTGLRGLLEYSQPKYFCDRCRRSFFPSGESTGDHGPERGHAAGAQKSRLGRGE